MDDSLIQGLLSIERKRHKHRDASLGNILFTGHAVGFCGLTGGGSSNSGAKTNWSGISFVGGNTKCYYIQSFGITGANNLLPESVSQETQGFLPNAMNMSLIERLNLAWKVLFPSLATRRNSNAKIAKQRLKMILFSDRCAVTDKAKQKIVSNIVDTLSEFVEIDSQDKVQLSVSLDSDLGTMYSVRVPVWRMKPEYDEGNDLEAVTNTQHKQTRDIQIR